LFVSLINRWEAGKSKANITAMKKLRGFCDAHGINFTVLEEQWNNLGKDLYNHGKKIKQQKLTFNMKKISKESENESKETADYCYYVYCNSISNCCCYYR